MHKIKQSYYHYHNSSGWFIYRFTHKLILNPNKIPDPLTGQFEYIPKPTKLLFLNYHKNVDNFNRYRYQIWDHICIK